MSYGASTTLPDLELSVNRGCLSQRPLHDRPQPQPAGSEQRCDLAERLGVAIGRVGDAEVTERAERRFADDADGCGIHEAVQLEWTSELGDELDALFTSQ